MSLEFSRRSFLKYTAVAAVAVAGASMFSGCEQTDTKNISCTGAGAITVLQVTAEMGTKGKDGKYTVDALAAGQTELEFPFKITVGRTNNLPINATNFKVTVTSKDGKTVKKYTSPKVTLEGNLGDTNLPKDSSASGTVKVTVDALAAEDKVVLTYCPDLQYAEYSLNWTLTVPAAEKKEEASEEAKG